MQRQKMYSGDVEDFLLQYDEIKLMRKTSKAPVDTMGCHALAQKQDPPAMQRFTTLISLMLSSQTRDQVTSEAIGRLHDQGLLDPEKLSNAEDKFVEKLIYPVGFYKRKVGYIKETAKICHEKYGNDIPRTLKDLCSLKGVGNKMAMLCMTHAWNEVVGIGVDVHVHRICNRLNWVNETKNPEATRKELESWLPKEHWKDVNEVIVGFGQQICKNRPQCSKCSLAQHPKVPCPYYEKVKETPLLKRRKVENKKDED